MKTLEQVRRGAGVNAENELRTVVWFSCGITSAIAARIALEESKLLREETRAGDVLRPDLQPGRRELSNGTNA